MQDDSYPTDFADGRTPGMPGLSVSRDHMFSGEALHTPKFRVNHQVEKARSYLTRTLMRAHPLSPGRAYDGRSGLELSLTASSVNDAFGANYGDGDDDGMDVVDLREAVEDRQKNRPAGIQRQVEHQFYFECHEANFVCRRRCDASDALPLPYNDADEIPKWYIMFHPSFRESKCVRTSRAVMPVG